MVDLAPIVENVRDHYFAQLESFVEQELAACTMCSPEVKFQMPEDNAIYGDLYCVYFVENDNGPVVTELAIETGLGFSESRGTRGGVEITLSTMRWDNVRIEANKPIADEDIETWFNYWFDVEEVRYDDAKTLGNIIHSALIDGPSISIDFGSSEPRAFWELVDALSVTGVTSITVTYGDGIEAIED
ncbi:hypothetical protein [Hyphococcus sp.]|uniref:hypothetical protein n=1 Tax=Hyphococcus sp. TaxID=2038636 RepID=UPI0020853029|nr:MAG: hypothetical protein DHS20C04_06190 [Marinicaulis sp.]